MGIMYRIDLSSLPINERKKYYQEIDQISEETFLTNKPGIFLSLWNDPKDISDYVQLPKGCTITKD